MVARVFLATAGGAPEMDLRVDGDTDCARLAAASSRADFDRLGDFVRPW